MQAARRLGMTPDEHTRAIGLLRRVHGALKDVGAMICGRSAASHPIRQVCRIASSEVQSLRLELERAGRAEHPVARLDYLSNTPGLSLGTLDDAVAQAGDDVDLND